MGRHDSGYHLLFAYPYFVECLIRGFVPGDWIDNLDFGSLEAVREGHPRDDIGMRYDDIVWRLRWGQQDLWVYIYLLIEFQRTDEPFMAVRVLDYEGGLYRQIVRALRLEKGDHLPIVLPLVLYHGHPEWKSSTEIYDLIAEAPPEIEPYLPHLRYLLLDVNSYAPNELERMNNPVACIFQLEGSQELDTQPIEQLDELLAEPQQRGLRRAASLWLTQVFLPLRLPGVTVPEVKHLEEVSPMIAEHAIDWSMQWREEGRKEGRQQGEATLLSRLMQQKFGVTSPEVHEKLRNADAEQLLDWGDRLMTATTIEEIFEDQPGTPSRR